MTILPSLKISRNSRRELIIEGQWPVLSILRKLCVRVLTSKTLFVGSVGGAGVFCGIMVAMTVLSPQVTLQAEVTSLETKELGIQKIIFPDQGAIFTITPGTQQLQANTSTIIYFPYGTKQATVLEKTNTSEEILLIKTNNGLYYRRLYEIRTITTRDLTAYVQQFQDAVVIYTPANILHSAYSVYVIK